MAPISEDLLPPPPPPTTRAPTRKTSKRSKNKKNNKKLKPPNAPKFIIIGAGSRGNAYARAITNATVGKIHAVAEPDPAKRRLFGKNYIWGDADEGPRGQEFADWRHWFRWEKVRRDVLEARRENPDDEVGVDGVIICTLDETHVEILTAIAPLNLHIMCEKPLATSLEDCLSIAAAIGGPTRATPSKIFSIGHVLRYSPHNVLLRNLLLLDRVVGEIVSVDHTEPVGWSHFAHSYVRGNWRRATPNGDGSLLTKCSHDIDFLLWLLSSPPPDVKDTAHPYHLPETVMSTGALTQFRKSRKPLAAGLVTNCLSCPVEQSCIYSAPKLYRDMHLALGKTGWPVKILCPDIEDTLQNLGMEAANKQLLDVLTEDYDLTTWRDDQIAARPWFGRCVYESDNEVCDNQTVTISWNDDPLPDVSLPLHERLRGRTAKTATLHMIAPTQAQCERRGRVYGTLGELSYDSRTITIYDFRTGQSRIVNVLPPPPDEEESHGGGDYGLSKAFVDAVDKVLNHGWDVDRAQREIVKCGFEEIIRGHALVFAAEESRRDGKVVAWKEWWKEKMLGGSGSGEEEEKKILGVDGGSGGEAEE
ncbi:hypothetical protein AJ80_00940 [Polytolypa hystricis UAMH7299]|uniref:Gfo/Idh/MocA-like oxidoreductase N-terminal domain-containing protein n=1 Tax=Polytolypa hystricis (strain UAMH7299) TaxID=1447883 RepID=A0A2B7Z298_POLH7|nr:hypothetical protein AJ80_00940 [Polytolypa hystricis UAMH7299]